MQGTPGVVDDDATDHEVTQPPGTEDVDEALAHKDYATSADINEDVEQEDVYLPMLRKWVVARVLESPELARLEYLPDMVGFGKMVEKLGTTGAKVDEAEYAEQNALYQAAVCHAAVMAPDAGEPAKCLDCGGEHPKPLWSMKQTRRLHQIDQAVIADTALSTGVGQAMRPFSKDETPSDSLTPAASGTLTPPTS